MKERRLGRGLESLLGAGIEEPEARAPVGGVTELAVDRIRSNPHQPRAGFEERQMAELADSIKTVGVLQPLIVRRLGDSYELIAGERRLRAARQAGLTKVPVVERQAADDDMLTLALVENLQRQDLNPVEKAKGFKELIKRFGLTQEAAARRIGKDRSTLANFIRLLELPESVQHVVSRGTISMGHARCLLGLTHASAQQALALRIEEEGLSVRQVERIVADMRSERPKPSLKRQSQKPAHIRDLEDKARQRLGTKVQIDHRDGRGRLIVEFYSEDDLQRILEVLGIGA